MDIARLANPHRAVSLRYSIALQAIRASVGRRTIDIDLATWIQPAAFDRMVAGADCVALMAYADSADGVMVKARSAGAQCRERRLPFRIGVQFGAPTDSFVDLRDLERAAQRIDAEFARGAAWRGVAVQHYLPWKAAFQPKLGGHLVNKLGIFGALKPLEITDELWRQYFEVNVLSAVRLIRLYLPWFDGALLGADPEHRQ